METATKSKNRQELAEAIWDETRPEKSGTWCWDGGMWDEKLPILHLYGDHGTPDFTLTFFKDRVLVSPDANTSWAKTVEVKNYNDLKKVAKDIVAATLIINLVGAI